MAKALVWWGLMLLTGCGGSAVTSLEAAGTGGVSDGGSDQVAGTSNAGDNAGSGSSNAGAGAGAGTGGKLPDLPSGGASGGPLACSTPYAGPSGGPRADGPTNLGNCATVPAETVLARYKDFSARVPQGLYYESDESITFWTEPCSVAPQETTVRGAMAGLGEYVESFATEWFYEAVYCSKEGVRRIERNLRCDYFDGSKLANPTPEQVAFLGSLHWWAENHDRSGSALLGYSISIGSATDVIDMCTVSVTYGDFGLCDEVRLESTKHLLINSGFDASGLPQSSVKLGQPELLRILKGDCH